MESIPRHEALQQVKALSKAPHKGFSISYRRQDGTLGRKERVVKSFNGEDNALEARTIAFIDLATHRPFKIKYDFWTHFNGLTLDAR